MTNTKLEEFIQELNRFADEVYEGNNVEISSFVQEIIPQIAAISELIKDDGLNNKLLNNALSPMLIGLEENDQIYIADIITFELLSILDEIKNTI
ncbi:MAG: hypothetical protein PUG10_00100 [Lachnospiraceae bacterium]|nr:hypothetical protein [Lachnospiraceae bacterium]